MSDIEQGPVDNDRPPTRSDKKKTKKTLDTCHGTHDM